MSAALLALFAVFSPHEAREGDLARDIGGLLDRTWSVRPEWGDMTVSILKGEAMDPAKGWWKSGGARHGWEWLRERLDVNGDGIVERAEWPLSPELFRRLDRDRDGSIGERDFAPGAVEPAGPWRRIFGRLDRDRNGRLTKEELLKFFDAADAGRLGFITRDELKDALEDPPRPKPSSGPPAANPADDDPSPWALLAMLASKQLGTLTPGPKVGDEAPDFTLDRLEGGSVLEGGRGFHLGDWRGKKPVFLVFGSFT